MKDRVGVNKEIDASGRLVIPKEMRERFGLDGMVELVVTEEGILIRNSQYVLVKREETAE